MYNNYKKIKTIIKKNTREGKVFSVNMRIKVTMNIIGKAITAMQLQTRKSSK